MPKFPLRKEDYDDWKVVMRAHFMALGLWIVFTNVFVADAEKETKGTGKKSKHESVSESESESASSSSAEVHGTVSQRMQAYGMLLKTLNKKQLQLVKQIEPGNAAEVWAKLESVYGTVASTASRVAMLDELKYLSIGKKESIEDLIARADQLLANLKHVGESISLAQRKYYILEALSSSDDWAFDVKFIRKVYKNDEWDADEFDQHLISEERSRLLNANKKNHEKRVENAYYANNMQQNNYRGRGNYNRGRGRGRGGFQQGNNNQNDAAPQNKQMNNHENPRNGMKLHDNRGGQRGRGNGRNINYHENRDCYNCGEYGHIAKNCPKNKRNENALNADEYVDNGQYDNNYSFMVTNADACNDVHAQTLKRKLTKEIEIEKLNNECMKLKEFACYTAHSVNDWVFDTGATRHFTGNKQALFDTQKLSTPSVVKTNNGKSTFDMVGKVKVKIGINTITLTDVAYVPGFHTNLISVARMTDKGFTFVSERTRAVVKIGTKTIFTVPRVGNLYVYSTEAAMVMVEDSHDQGGDNKVITDSHTSTGSKLVTDKPCTHVHSSERNVMKSHEISRNFMVKDSEQTKKMKENAEKNEKKVHEKKIEEIKREMRLLHARYGHMSYHAIWKLIQNESVTGHNHALTKLSTQIVNELQSERCDACLEGKMIRKK